MVGVPTLQTGTSCITEVGTCHMNSDKRRKLHIGITTEIGSICH